MNQTKISEPELRIKTWRPLMELQYWHALDRVRKGDNTLEYALGHWTMTWFWIPWKLCGDDEKTPRDERPMYRRLLGEFNDCARAHQSDCDPSGFSRDAAGILAPWIEKSSKTPGSNPADELKWIGCFAWNQPPSDNSRALLHFYNACCPNSPFEQMDALRDDLLQCLADMRAKAPSVIQVSCGSWINNLEPFLSLFPETYVRSLTVSSPDSKSGMGWWGQFVTKEGTLNEKRADELRATGRFRYDRKEGTCLLEELPR
ncbi:MAG: hypothetical protein PHV34_00990 [Verrucomicrobiae bacterium]|nr:hypothetical protein [Verrucomicrobiae bacterium]